MELKNIETANSYYEIVKLLDSEILALQKQMKFVFENEISATIQIKIDKPQKQEKYKDPFDALDQIQNALIQRMSQMHEGSFHVIKFEQGGIVPQPKKQEGIYILGDSETLAMLELLIKQKENRRNKMLRELEKLGFTV